MDTRTCIAGIKFLDSLPETKSKCLQENRQAFRKMLDSEIANEQGKPDNPPNGRPQYYVSECPDTNRQFLVEHGVDNNIAELTMGNVRQIRSLFGTKANVSGRSRRKSDLYGFLQEEFKRYRTEIMPLCPAPDEWKHFHHKEQEFDDAKNEFLESLWDVISQYFEDKLEASDNG